MATRIYSISVGDVANQVTEGVGAAVAAESIELTVDLGDANISPATGRDKVLQALEHIKNHIIAGNWPPA